MFERLEACDVFELNALCRIAEDVERLPEADASALRPMLRRKMEVALEIEREAERKLEEERRLEAGREVRRRVYAAFARLEERRMQRMR